MTAEIAVMNRLAVALAADSAVTIKTETGQKIYNTVNKLFSLSKYRPVGVMIYGSASFMDVPWETIIKVYRARLGRKSFTTLAGYADEFIGFLNRRNPMIPLSIQEQFYRQRVEAYYRAIRNDLENKVRDATAGGKAVANKNAREFASSVIHEHYGRWRKATRVASANADQERRLRRKYRALIIEARKQVFGTVPMGKKEVKELMDIAVMLCTRDLFSSDLSGVVIAGFGERDTFPGLVEYRVQDAVANRLKFAERQKTGTSFECGATITPFAQSEMVCTFMEGMDPFYGQMLSSYLPQLLEKVANCIVASFSSVSEKEKQMGMRQLGKAIPEAVRNFHEELSKHRNTRFVSPVLQAVAALPKDELAAMAESLVNLTSFKRRITTTPETVGGPIDVAVISKGDGFVWIRRKHYFQPELNPQFFATYNERQTKEATNGA